MNGLALVLMVLLSATAATFALGAVLLLLGRRALPREAGASLRQRAFRRTDRPHVADHGGCVALFSLGTATNDARGRRLDPQDVRRFATSLISLNRNMQTP